MSAAGTARGPGWSSAPATPGPAGPGAAPALSLHGQPVPAGWAAIDPAILRTTCLKNIEALAARTGAAGGAAGGVDLRSRFEEWSARLECVQFASNATGDLVRLEAGAATLLFGRKPCETASV